MGDLGVDEGVLLKWNLMEVEDEWVRLSEDGDKLRAFVNTVTNLRYS